MSKQDEVVEFLSNGTKTTLDINLQLNESIGYGFAKGDGDKLHQGIKHLVVRLKKNDQGGFYVLTAFPDLKSHLRK